MLRFHIYEPLDTVLLLQVREKALPILSLPRTLTVCNVDVTAPLKCQEVLHGIVLVKHAEEPRSTKPNIGWRQEIWEKEAAILMCQNRANNLRIAGELAESKVEAVDGFRTRLAARSNNRNDSIEGLDDSLVFVLVEVLIPEQLKLFRMTRSFAQLLDCLLDLA